MNVHGPADLPAEVRAWLPEGSELRRAGQGATSEVIVAVGPREALVVKRCSEAPYNTWLEHEYRALVALESTDLPVPRPIGFHRAGTRSEDPAWLVMTHLPGTPLWDAIEQADEREREAWFRRLGALLAKIHGTAVPPALQEASPQPWIDPTLKRATSFVRRHAVDHHPELLERLGRAVEPRAFEALIHGDFTLDNVLAQGDRITGVIDWGGATRGDPAWDITLALTTEPDLRLTPGMTRAFFEGYRSFALPAELRRYIDERYPPEAESSESP